MKPLEIIAYLKEHIVFNDQLIWDYNRKEERLKVTHKEWKKGLTIGISELSAKFQTKGEAALTEVLYIINQTFVAMEKEREEGWSGEQKILPIIRSTSFPQKNADGVQFITEPHTAETRIFYALDLGTTYRIIDEDLLKELKITANEMKERALFLAQSLPIIVKKDVVDDNVFYFFNTNDGYDASRILNRSLLKEYSEKVEGHMTVAVPHQDVLIIGDIRNNVGYDVLAQMAMHFFTVGTVPITSLPFIYENGKLEPIFILAKNRRVEEGEE